MKAALCTVEKGRISFTINLTTPSVIEARRAWVILPAPMNRAEAASAWLGLGGGDWAELRAALSWLVVSKIHYKWRDLNKRELEKSSFLLLLCILEVSVHVSIFIRFFN